MSDTWDDYAEGWDTNDAVIAYSEKAFQSLTETIDINGIRVLDFGCGTGHLSKRLSPHVEAIVATDTSVKMLSVLASKQLENVTLQHAEFTQKHIEEDVSLSLSRGFDLIVASSVFAFIDKYHETLNLLKRLLQPGGYLVQWDWLKENDDSKFGFTMKEVKVSLSAAGFSEIKVRIPFCLENECSNMKVVMGVGKNVLI